MDTKFRGILLTLAVLGLFPTNVVLGVGISQNNSDSLFISTAHQDREHEAVTIENVTIRSLRLQNTTLLDVTFTNIEANLTAENISHPENAEKLTSNYLVIQNATLHNVRFENLTIRNQTITADLFSKSGQTHIPDNLTVEHATMANVVIRGITIQGLFVNKGTIETVTWVESQEIRNRSISETPTIMAQTMMVGSATVEKAVAANVSVQVIIVNNRNDILI